MSYGYYKTSSRGRGFSSRGTFHGRGGESSFYSRGSYRGRSSWQSERSTGFDSRSRYVSGSGNRGQVDDSGYRRYNRDDEVEYSSHDRSYDGSRKRIKSEYGYSQASSARRTHEGGYEGGTDYNSRYSYAEDKDGYGYREERRTSGGFRDRSRDEYSHRKQEPLVTSMPPSSGSSRYMSSVRGSFRGRIRTRGFRGISRIPFTRRTSTFLGRKRSLVDANAVRKRIISARSQADTLRKLRILKLRRLRETALRKAAISKKEDGTSKATEDISDDDDDEDEEDEENEKEAKDDAVEGDTVSKKEKLKKAASKKLSTEEGKEGMEVEDDDDEEEEDEEEDGKAKAETASNEDEDTKEDAVAEESGHSHTLFRGRPFIKLNCPHCYTRCITFQQYNAHLYTFKHINAVKKLWRLHTTMLTTLRNRQRRRQRVVDEKIEEAEEDEEDLPLNTNYCIVCKLNYGETKTEHVASEYHKKILEFLKPYCRICQFKLSSPMMYEKHLCSLDHIKRKALLTSKKDTKGKLKDGGSGGEEEDEKELDLENFMTLDSVGTFDDTSEENKKEGDDKVKKEEKKSKAEVNLGDEHIKKVNVQFCELCHMYLPRSDQIEKALLAHCRSRAHLLFYMRYRRTMERKEAQERRKKLLAKKKAKIEAAAKKKSQEEEDNEEKTEVNKESVPKVNGDSEEVAEKSSEEKTEDKAADVSSSAAGETHEMDLETDEKMWADVDKDLGDILREVEPDNKSSDEDDDGTEGGRYDRFKYSEKGNAVEDPGKATKEGGDPSVEMDTDDQTKVQTDTKSGAASPVKKTPSTPSAATSPATAASK